MKIVMGASVLVLFSLYKVLVCVICYTTDVDGDDMEVIWSETMTSPSIHNVHLTGKIHSIL